MTDYTFCELREREFINVADGQKLGRVVDVAFNACGKILGFVVPGEKKLFKNVTGAESIFVAWDNVLKIGDDVVLVDLNNDKPPCCIPKISGK